jgi:hypothetical protein
MGVDLRRIYLLQALRALRAEGDRELPATPGHEKEPDEPEKQPGNRRGYPVPRANR